MTIDPVSTIFGALCAYILWLLGWGGKHLHDAIILPRIRDLWARKSTQSALQMADQVLQQFEIDMRKASDPRYLVLHVYRMLSAAVLSSTAFITLLLVLLFWNQLFAPVNVIGEGQALLLLLLPVLYAFWLFMTVNYEYKRTVGIFLNLDKHRTETVARLEKLLVAGGLDNDQVHEWLRRVQPVPIDGRERLANNDRQAGALR
jgi:hypothetical protein